MGDYFKCPRCGNTDKRKIGYLNGKPYCRACIAFQGETIKRKEDTHFVDPSYSLEYPLTNDQDKISENVLNNLKEKKDTLIYAVCGAGKTELVYKTMHYVLSHHGVCGFAIPRRDVVIEIYYRIKSVFKLVDIALVYGGHTEKLEGDIICLTTHQLYRYENYFDLLIIDEIDAFPYKDNLTLSAFKDRSIKGQLVMLSATPSKEDLDFFSHGNRSILKLETRFHGYPLPVPEIIIRYHHFKLVALIKLLKQFLKEGKPAFIFTPTIEKAEQLFKILKYVFPKIGMVVHSKKEDRNDIILDFKHGKYKFLVTTAVLERGVTVRNLQVVIYEADHKLYDDATLVQISGRVGRKIDAPSGRVVFLVDEENENIQKCIEQINRANESLS